jgi:hypothetical protein
MEQHNKPHGPVKQALNVIASTVLIGYALLAVIYVGYLICMLLVAGSIVIGLLALVGAVVVAREVAGWSKRKGWY